MLSCTESSQASHKWTRQEDLILWSSPSIFLFLKIIGWNNSNNASHSSIFQLNNGGDFIQWLHSPSAWILQSGRSFCVLGNWVLRGISPTSHSPKTWSRPPLPKHRDMPSQNIFLILELLLPHGLTHQHYYKAEEFPLDLVLPLTTKKALRHSIEILYMVCSHI